MCLLFIPILCECTLSKAYAGRRAKLNTDLALLDCNAGERSRTKILWLVWNLGTGIDREGWFTQNISLWVISVSKLKSLATIRHFETEWHFLVTKLVFACSRTCPQFPLCPFHSLQPNFLVDHFPQSGLAVTLLMLYLAFQSRQPSLLPSGQWVHGGAGTEVSTVPSMGDNPRQPPKAELAPPMPFTDAGAEAQRGHPACLRSHSFESLLLILPVIKVVTEIWQCGSLKECPGSISFLVREETVL